VHKPGLLPRSLAQIWRSRPG